MANENQFYSYPTTGTGGWRPKNDCHGFGHHHHYCCGHRHKCSCGYCFDCGMYVARMYPRPWSQPLHDGGWIGGGGPMITYCNHSQ